MKEYFKGVDFSELPPPAPPPAPKPKLSRPEQEEVDALRRELDAFHATVMGVLNAVRSGDSELARATTLSSALLEVLSRVHQAPSKPRIREFIMMTRSDINNRVAQEMERIIDSKLSYTATEGGSPYQFPTLRGMYRGE